MELCHTTIRILKSTRERLADLGKKKETYDEIINRLINSYLKNNEETTNR
ncbi:hypothetical protein MUP77_23555 [Candidatus Bathyarchaeota archaeon]|nr:hypothetical protein [Candidatus Bathyarchaeota archaeon]